MFYFDQQSTSHGSSTVKNAVKYENSQYGAEIPNPTRTSPFGKLSTPVP